MKEEFLFCNTLSTTATAIDIKAVVECFFKANGLSWLNFKHICTVGAPAMVGAKGGFVTLVKNEWPHVMSSHCSLHRHTLATKTTFDRNYGHYGESYQLHSCKGQKSSTFPNFS